MPDNIVAIMPRDLPGIVSVEPAVRSIFASLRNVQVTLAVHPDDMPLVERMPGNHALMSCNLLSPLSAFRFQGFHRGILFGQPSLGAPALFLSRVKKRVGFRGPGITPLLNRPIRDLPESKKMVRVRRMVELVAYFGCTIVDRIPNWEQGPVNKDGEKLLILSGRFEKLPSKVIRLWQDSGFSPLSLDHRRLEDLDRLAAASLVVGPPDSAVTLARAMNIPAIRITGGKVTAEDEFPMKKEPLINWSKAPEEVLGELSLI